MMMSVLRAIITVVLTRRASTQMAVTPASAIKVLITPESSVLVSTLCFIIVRINVTIICSCNYSIVKSKKMSRFGLFI